MLMRSSRRFFSAFSLMNSWERISRVRMAASLSSSARRSSSSFSSSFLLSTTPLARSDSSLRSFFSSRS